MRREIKFRAWHLEDGMLYFDFDTFKLDYHDQYGNIMQFTGLKDKNGKEIYEGDIISHFHNYVGENKTSIEIVEVPNIYFKAIHTVEVIGNIHQDKELLNN